MKLPTWHEEAIAKHHARDAFDCGEEALNNYLSQYARKNHERGVSKTFLAITDDKPAAILGYYSLSPASIAHANVPEAARRGGGRYDVPAFRLGRLAVALPMQGCGLGGQLLMAAVRRCILAATEIGGTALLIDAKSDRAAAWYETYGAVRLIDAPNSLLLLLASFEGALRAGGKL